TERSVLLAFFFFQAEDGIRDKLVTGVQTCALPISRGAASARDGRAVGARTGAGDEEPAARLGAHAPRRGGRARRFPGRARSGREIGRASCRERVWISVGGVPVEENA